MKYLNKKMDNPMQMLKAKPYSVEALYACWTDGTHGVSDWQCVQALLSNAFAWMRKASEDSLDGMVALLQKVLQLYAAKALSTSGAGGLKTTALTGVLTAKTQSEGPAPVLAGKACTQGAWSAIHPRHLSLCMHWPHTRQVPLPEQQQ